MTFAIIYTIAALFIIFASMEFPGICSVKPKSVLRFLGVMAYVTVFRIIMHKLSGLPHIPDDPNSPMNTINLLTTLGVYWEDAIFTLPALMAYRRGESKLFKGLLLGLSAFVFASGHIDYGLPWAAATFFYIPFISYKYGKTNGLGTVMICHILYDVITLATVRYLL